MVQYYRGLRARWSNMLAPLTSLAGECGQTKVSKARGTKKLPWHWDKVHQKTFDHMKATIAKEVVLAYLDFSKVFEIYTDASNKQLGAVPCTMQIQTLVTFKTLIQKRILPILRKNKPSCLQATHLLQAFTS